MGGESGCNLRRKRVELEERGEDGRRGEGELEDQEEGRGEEVGNRGPGSMYEKGKRG